MEDSILTSVKKMLGIAEDYDHFDQDIITFINNALMNLTQIGVGVADGLVITDETSKWNEFVLEKRRLGSIQSYVYMKVKLAFDPPQSSFTVESMKGLISEMEWRLNADAEASGKGV